MSEEMGVVIAEHDSPLPAVIEATPVTLFGTDDPVAVIEKATAVAKALASVIEEQKLYTQIQNKRHIRVEGWTLLGSMLGVFPETEWTRRTIDSKGEEAYEARVVARTRDGSVVGAREAMCSRSEARWKNADDYALRSMAQTRAVSGALAAPLRFVVVLAGYEGTPEAEMPHGGAQKPAQDVPAPDVVIHFGKNKGKKIGSLTEKQIGWYANVWEPDPGFRDAADDALKAAAIECIALEKAGDILDPEILF